MEHVNKNETIIVPRRKEQALFLLREERAREVEMSHKRLLVQD